MKGRTKFFNYFIACIATLSLATFAACSDDDPETPSGKLVLTASASSFVAGEGNVTFRVLSLRTAAQVYVYDVRELCYGTRIFRCAG